MSDLFTYVKHDSDNQILLSLFKAYRNARKNKRAKRSQVAFEYAYESKLIKLHKDIMNRRYIFYLSSLSSSKVGKFEYLFIESSYPR